jgi:hypothetical protein
MLLLAPEKPVKQAHESLLLLGMQRPYTDYLPREFFAEYIPLMRPTRDVIPAVVGLRYPLGGLLVEARQ